MSYMLIHLLSLILLTFHGSNANAHGLNRAKTFNIPAGHEKRNFAAASGNGTTPWDKQQALGYITQNNAAKELVAISQPSSVRNIQYLQNYVYEDHAGRGSWVYHVESGVNFRKLSAEFPNVADNHLITPLAASKGWKPWDDHSIDRPDVDDPNLRWHSTCTAGKAVGQTYGVSKNAKLVVVQIYDAPDEILRGFQEIYKDLQAHPERRKHSVITMSVTEPYNPRADYSELHVVLLNIMELDVPIVVVAGNDGRDPNRRNIDTIPGVLARDRGFPLIVVGSVDATGQRADSSQLGENTNAVGVDISCLEDDPSNPATGIGGTSYSAPQVAGQIATWLSMDKVPFDTTSHLVWNVRAYLESDAAGWVRAGNARVLWNGVTEADNPQVPIKKCYGLTKDDFHRYVERPVLASIVQDRDQFCDEAARNGGSVSKEYHAGTLNHVKMSVIYTDPSRTRSRDECVRWMLELTDGCDTSPDGNPANFKGGGIANFDDVKYYIEPQASRTDPALGFQGKRTYSWAAAYTSFHVSGHGWLSDDFGQALLHRLNPNSVGVTDWQFDYGDWEDDGTEWECNFHGVVGAQGRVEKAIREAGGPQDIHCNKKGI